jgi:TPR repeat protein
MSPEASEQNCTFLNEKSPYHLYENPLLLWRILHSLSLCKILSIRPYEVLFSKTDLNTFHNYSQQGNDECQYLLALDHLFSSDQLPNIKKFSEDIEKLALQGNMWAQCVLGDFYDQGEMGHSQSYKDALKCYQQAAAQGHPRANMLLGYYFQHGFGIQKSEEKAVAYYKNAAKLGNKQAFGLLGHCFEAGIGVSQSCEEANFYYQLYGYSRGVFFSVLEYLPLDKRSISSEKKAFEKQQAFLYLKSKASIGDSEAIIKLEKFKENDAEVIQPIDRLLRTYRPNEKAPVVPSSSIKYRIKHMTRKERSSEIIKDFEKENLDHNDPEDARDIAFIELQKKAEEGDVDAQFQFAQLLDLKGYRKLSNAYLELAADQGHPKACFWLGLDFDIKAVNESDVNQALYYYQKAADLENWESQERLAEFYEWGIHVDQSYEKAIEYLKKAGLSDSLSKLGSFYEEGICVKKDLPQAREYYSRHLTDRGEENVKKLIRASLKDPILKSPTHFLERCLNCFFLHQKARAMFSDANAQYMVGLCYEFGFGIEIDVLKAFHCYLLAANQFFPEGERSLGRCYENYVDGVASKESAVYYYKRAAEHGDPWSLGLLARCFEKGIGVDQSTAQAQQLYSQFLKNISEPYQIEFFPQLTSIFTYLYQGAQSFLKNHLTSIQEQVPINEKESLEEQQKLYAYAKRLTLPPIEDHSLALHFFNLLAEQGLKDAHSDMAQIYLHGRGTNRSFEKAFDHFKILADQGDSVAQYHIAAFYAFGKSSERSSEKAFSYLQKSSQNGFIRSVNLLELCYKHGFGTPVDLNQAQEYYKKSANAESNPTTVPYSQVTQNNSSTRPLFFKATQNLNLEEQLFFRFGCLIQNQYKEYPTVFKINIDHYLSRNYLFNLPSKFKKYTWTCSKQKPLLNVLKAIDLKLSTANKEQLSACLKQQANMGDPKAQYQLAISYFKGTGVQESKEKYLYYLQLSAAQGYAKAEYDLGFDYDYGYSGLPQSYENALHYYALASAHGFIFNDDRLGYFYERGLATAQSYEKAFYYYAKLVNHDEDLSCAGYLAYCYENGLGVEQSLELAYKYYKYFLKYSLGREKEYFRYEKSGLEYLEEEENEEKGYRYLQKAFHYFKAKALSGDPEAQIKVAQYYLNGYGTAQSLDLAEHYMRYAHETLLKNADLDSNDPEDARTLAVLQLEKKADNGDPEAQLEMAYIYGQGINVKQSFDLHNYYLQLSALRGLPEAQYSLGFAFEFANGSFPFNLKKAAYWYKLAAEQRNTSALISLGYFYANGIEVEKSIEKAIECYEAAAEARDAKAVGLLGYCYEHGIGYSVSIEDAKGFYRDAGEHLHVDRKAYYESKYFGDRVNSKFPEKHQLLLSYIYNRSKAEIGDPNAQCEVGNFYRTGDCSIVRNSLKDAVEYYEAAIAQEHPEAMRWIGYFYEKGLYYDQSYEKAVSYYQRAADLKDGVALSLLGQCYEEGKGVSKSDEKAKIFYKLSLEADWNNDQQEHCPIETNAFLRARAFLGNGDAYYHLAKFHLGKLPFGKSDELSRHYLQKAIDLGYAEGAFSLGNIYDFEERNFEKAAHYYQLAAKQGHETAIAYLGYLYEFGLGLEKTIEKAVECYKKAAKQGDPCGMRALGHCYKYGKGLPQEKELETDYCLQAFKTDNKHEYNSNNINLYISVRQFIRIDSDAADPLSNDPQSNLHLGDIYHRGIGTRRDDEKARKYYQIASKQGNRQAQEMLNHFDKAA